MKRRGRLAAVILLASLCAPPLAAPNGGAAAAQGSAETLFIEAQKSLARGDYDGAETLLAESLARDPSFVSAIWQLAQIRESRGDLRRARELLARGLAVDPGASWARERLAGIDTRLAAIEKRKRADRLERLVKDARRVMAQTGPGEGDAFRAALRSILAEDPNHPWALEEQRLLEEREAVPMPPPVPAREIAVAPSDSTPGAGLASAVATVAAPPSAERRDPETGPGRSDAARHRLILLHLPAMIAALAAAVLAVGLRRRASARGYPLAGSIGLVPVLDAVALLSGNRRTGLLAVAGDGVAGEICFETGNVVHARCGELSGKKAFRRLMEVRSGRFHFHNRLTTARRTIAEPLSLLLLSTKSREDAPAPSGGRPAPRETAASRR
jgi:tetratricopeptide (TPR) repeat protein